MSGPRSSPVEAIYHVLHRNFLALLLGAYVLAAALPDAGVWLGATRFGASLFGVETHLSAPPIMLGFLLFSAALSVRGQQLRQLVRRPHILAAGLLANTLVPTLILVLAAPVMSYWHNDAEMRYLLIGLVLVAAMPVAGSSSGWSRTADGDCGLSLGLIMLSTLLSPLITPIILRAVGTVASQGAGEDLNVLASSTAGAFLTGWVVGPTLLGLLVRWLIGGPRADSAAPMLKLATFVTLLVLCYINATRCLPDATRDPDWDYLAFVLAAVLILCGLSFANGFGVARAVGANPSQRASLVFALGMTNNGTGLVLASSTAVGSSAILLPLVVYNLVQHLAAGLVEKMLSRQ